MITDKTPASLKTFIWISRGEAISYLLLLGIAMPLKYALEMPLMVKYVGWAHGVLFMAYMAQLLWVSYQLKWDVLRIIYGFIASLLPFGPFVFERSLGKSE
jgi:integral membrane protein